MINRICGLAVLMLIGVGMASADTEYAAPGSLFEVEGHRMHLHCTGQGAPTVVLDSGLGGTSLDWSRVQPWLSDSNRVCSYDRPGYGWSRATPGTRSSAVIARELHKLLQRADEAPPYVLVGHSFGGWNMQLFEHQYPEDVAGLVLVDASQARQIERYEQAGTAVAPRGRFMVFSPATIPPALPAGIRPVVEHLTYRAVTNRTVHTELAAFRDSALQVQQTSLPPELPLVVVSRGRPIRSANASAVASEELWRDMQQEFVESHPGAVHLVAQHSGHHVHLEQPGVVAGAICIAMQMARAGETRRLPRGWLEQRCLNPLRSASAYLPAR